MVTMMSTSGLISLRRWVITADFGMANVLVFGLPVLPLALSIDRVTNGATRPLFGWISDRIGRENTMLIAFGLEGTAMTLWLLARHSPVLFVLLSGLVFFGWGEIFSLFPSTLTDTFGTAHATSNYGFLYMAQGIRSVLGGPMAALLHERTGSWIPVFALIIVMDAATAVLAIAVLRPMRARWFARLGSTPAGLDGRPGAAVRPRLVPGRNGGRRLVAPVAPNLGAPAAGTWTGRRRGVFAIFFLYGISLSTERLRGACALAGHLIVQLFTFVIFPAVWVAVNAMAGPWLPRDLMLGSSTCARCRPRCRRRWR
jgi:MFS family permease